jgi:NADH dehydrogenase FAD-containing subunit
MSSMAEKQRIVVVGGGYAGALAAVRLAGGAGRGATITLVEPRPALVQRLRLHQLATGQEVRELELGRLTGRRVENVRARAVGVDPDRGALSVERDGRPAEIRFDQILLTHGSAFDLGAVPGVAEHAHSLAGPAAAIRLREALGALAEGSSVAVCGGGFTGIEAAAEIAAMRTDLRVTLLSAGRIGASMSKLGRTELRARLGRLGVELADEARVEGVEPGRIDLGHGSSRSADVVVWCGGFSGRPLARDSGLPVDSRGLLLVDRTLRSVRHPNVLAAGDAAAIPDLPNGAAYRMTCQAGMPSGAHAADTAVAALRGREPEPFDFGYIHQPISLGRRDGVIQWVDRADRPKEKVLVGRRAALYKELVTRSPAPSIRWERRLPGALRWPSAGKVSAAAVTAGSAS